MATLASPESSSQNTQKHANRNELKKDDVTGINNNSQKRTSADNDAENNDGNDTSDTQLIGYNCYVARRIMLEFVLC